MKPMNWKRLFFACLPFCIPLLLHQPFVFGDPCGLFQNGYAPVAQMITICTLSDGQTCYNPMVVTHRPCLTTSMNSECYPDPVKCTSYCTINVIIGSGPCVPIPLPGGGGEEDCVPEDCPDGSIWDFEQCRCASTNSPILVSSRGNRIELTDATDGADFDLDGDGSAERLGWTKADSDDAFLALDRNGNGIIDDGTELFGTYSPQFASPEPNGFHALAWHDDPANGGNGDGSITTEDEVFSHLLFWFDRNHDGVSQPSELKPITASNVIRISFEYRQSRRLDRFGNEFRYISNVTIGTPGRGLQRKFAVDVYLVGG